MNCNELRAAPGLRVRARLALAALLLAATGAATAAPISVTIVGPAVPVAAGGTFTLDLRVSGLGPQVPLSGYDFSLRYDDSLVTYQSATFSTALGGASEDYADGPAASPFSIGTQPYVNLLAVSALLDDELLSRQPDAGFSLLTLVFRAGNVAGDASFGLALLGPGGVATPGFLGAFGETGPEVLEATLGAARVSIAAPVGVPEPGTGSLVVAFALVAVAARAARRAAR